MLRNTVDSYGSLTKTLHWLIAILIIAMLALGFLLESIPEHLRGFWVGLHKSVGLTLLLLMFIRLIWRFLNIQPLLPITVPAWEQLAARSVHVFLYLVLFAMPVTGLAMSSYGGHPVFFWGWFNAALPVAENKNLASTFFDAHSIIAWVIIALIVLHVAAALKHHFIEKNNVLRKMLPGYKPPKLFRE